MIKLPNWLLYGIVIAITVVWAASFVGTLVIESYKPPAEINLLFTSIAGGLILGGRGKGKDDSDSKEDGK